MTSQAIHEIETARLLMRGPQPDDLAAWSMYVADPEYLRYIPWRPLTPQQRAERNLNAVAQVWEQHTPGDIAWVIALKATGQIMGWSGAGPSIEGGDAELVYMLGKPFWGQGFATEAARAVIRYGFENRPWDRIVATIQPENIGSLRVLEHLGFAYEKDVNYIEMTGDPTMQMDSPIVPYYALQRDKFAPGEAYYQVKTVPE